MAGVGGAKEWAADLLQAAADVELGNAAVIKATGDELLGLIKSRAPVGDSGDYRESWKAEPSSHAGETTVSVYTEAAQAARLEYGFHGTDSLGRHYDQPPQSHQRAGNDAVYPQVPVALQAVIDEALRG